MFWLEYIQQRIWKKYVKENPHKLADVPEQFITQEMCKEVFQKLPAYVPEQFITQEMCNNISQKRWWSLYDIPEKFRTLEMYREAIKREIDIRFLYDYIPEEFRKDPVIFAGVTCEVCGLADIEVIRRCNDCLKVICSQKCDECVYCGDDGGFVYCDDCSYTTTVRVCKRH